MFVLLGLQIEMGQRPLVRGKGFCSIKSAHKSGESEHRVDGGQENVKQQNNKQKVTYAMV